MMLSCVFCELEGRVKHENLEQQIVDVVASSSSSYNGSSSNWMSIRCSSFYSRCGWKLPKNSVDNVAWHFLVSVYVSHSNLFIYPYIYCLFSFCCIADLEQGYCVKRIYAGGDQSFAHYFTASVSFYEWQLHFEVVLLTWHNYVIQVEEWSVPKHKKGLFTCRYMCLVFDHLVKCFITSCIALFHLWALF